ncbi:MAG: hypothetical protein WCQ47_05875 [bacterium]
MKKIILPILVIFFFLCITDFIVNNFVLARVYDPMKSLLILDTGARMSLIYLANIVHGIALVGIYNMFIKKSVGSGIKLGVLYGLGYGFGFGFGFYAVMPTAFSIIITWIISCFVQISLSGLIIGYMNKEQRPA